MKMLFLFIFAVLGIAFTLAENEIVVVNVTRGHVFVYDLSKAYNNSLNELAEGYRYSLSPSDGPDLPSWLFTKKHEISNRVYLFGAPPMDSDITTLEIRVFCTTYHNYKTWASTVILKISEPSDDISHGIRIRISNSYIEHMLETSRWKALIEIFENYFWEQAKGKLYLTFLADSEDLGFKKNPYLTAGVVMHLGSSKNFSQALIDLQNETIPLSKHCPEDFYKRVTVERFFRPKNFVIDWCYFKLIDYNNCKETSYNKKLSKCDHIDSHYNSPSHSLSDDIEKLTEKAKLPNLEMLEVFVVVVFVPSILVMISLISWLISFMCLHHNKLKEDECSLDEDFNKMASLYDLM